MALLSLRDKIKAKLQQPNCSEEGVLYLLVEIGKYLERSHPEKKHLGEPDAPAVEPQSFPTLVFFRNWAAHTEKERGPIPASVHDCLKKASDGHFVDDEELFRPLFVELVEFAHRIGADLRLCPNAFTRNLKLLLSEQPVWLPNTQARIGYNGELSLTRL